MVRRVIFGVVTLTAALLAIGALAQPGHAVGTGTVSVGTTVYDATGGSLGRVESVVADARGRALQVLVRTPSGAGGRAQLKTLPIASLRPQGDGLVVALRKAEFDLLPSVERR